MRYLLQGGAKCRTLCGPLFGLSCIWIALYGGPNFEGLSELSLFMAGTADGGVSLPHYLN